MMWDLPNGVVGLAILVEVWVVLWWLAGGRRPLTWRGEAAMGVAFTVLAVDGGGLWWLVLGCWVGRVSAEMRHRRSESAKESERTEALQ